MNDIENKGKVGGEKGSSPQSLLEAIKTQTSSDTVRIVKPVNTLDKVGRRLLILSWQVALMPVDRQPYRPLPCAEVDRSQ